LIGCVFAVFLLLLMSVNLSVPAMPKKETKFEKNNSGPAWVYDYFYGVSKVRDLEPYGIGKMLQFNYKVFIKIYKYDDGTTEQKVRFNGQYGQYGKSKVVYPSLAKIENDVRAGKNPTYTMLRGKYYTY